MSKEVESATFSILRIKRKRTTNQLPLDALVIEQPEPSTKRRKATHTPAPIVPQTSRGIFRFAETVSIDSFDDAVKTRQVKDRIESFLTRPASASHTAVSNLQQQSRPLARIPSSASLRQAQSGSVTPQSPFSRPSTPTSKSGRKLPSSAAALLSQNQPQNRNSPLSSSVPSAPHNQVVDSAPSPSLQRKRTRYRIVTDPSPTTSASDDLLSKEREFYLAELQEETEILRGLRPPRVLSQAEILARKERREAFERREREAEEAQRRGNKGSTRIYDAIAEEEDDVELGRRNGKKKLRRESNGTKKKEAEDSSMMDNFGDMLKEYLTLQDSTERFPSSSASPSSNLPSSTALETPTSIGASSDDEEDETLGEESDSGEFVYDVYYRDLRDTAATGSSTSTSLEGTPGGSSSGFDVSSLEGLKRIGELAGLEEDEDLLLRVDGEGESESEVEDNADQDSNEENDYRNDYPDEESEDEDRWDESDNQDEDDDEY